MDDKLEPGTLFSLMMPDRSPRIGFRVDGGIIVCTAVVPPMICVSPLDMWFAWARSETHVWLYAPEDHAACEVYRWAPTGAPDGIGLREFAPMLDAQPEILDVSRACLAVAGRVFPEVYRGVTLGGAAAYKVSSVLVGPRVTPAEA